MLPSMRRLEEVKYRATELLCVGSCEASLRLVFTHFPGNIVAETLSTLYEVSISESRAKQCRKEQEIEKHS